MGDNRTILYIHGMGGGVDSRIPSILHDCFSGEGPEVVIRTYDFDPETARGQLVAWVDELRPAVLVGESLGAVHAISLRNHIAREGTEADVPPVILVSPALNAPVIFHRLAFLALIPGVSALLGRIYRPRPGERQKLDFTYGKLRKWKPFCAEAFDASGNAASSTSAFFGTRDHYRRSGIVSLKRWRRVFGDDSFVLYDGTHFMEEEYVRSLLVPEILETLVQVGRQ